MFSRLIMLVASNVPIIYPLKTPGNLKSFGFFGGGGGGWGAERLIRNGYSEKNNLK